MSRPITLVTGQWADLPLKVLCEKARGFGFDGLELGAWGDHFNVRQAMSDSSYVSRQLELLASFELRVFSFSNHCVGQCVCDHPGPRHRVTVPAYVWGDGDPEGVRQRAAQEMIDTMHAARQLGVGVVNCFVGSSIWPLLYAWPPVPAEMISAGFDDFARRWGPILDAYHNHGMRLALEVHPTEIAFDIASAERALDAVGQHPAFGFNYDPSHFGYQGVDYVRFIRRFGERIYHVHIKDVWWAEQPTEAGVFGGHLPFGDPRRFWDFRSPGRGRIDFEAIIRALNEIGYQGPLSIEWEDNGMEREYGAAEACDYIRRLDFPPSAQSYEAAFNRFA